MERKVKYLSIISIIILISFIVTMLIAAVMSVNGNEGTLFNILYNSSQVLMYVSLALYVVSFGLGVYCIINRRSISKKNNGKKSENKFPIAWFIISSVIFILILVFIILVMKMEVN